MSPSRRGRSSGTGDDPDRTTDDRSTAERIAQLEARSRDLEAELERRGDRLRDAVATTKVQTRELKQVRRELDALRRRRSVRLAVAVADRVRPVAARIRAARHLADGGVAGLRDRVREGQARRSRRVAPAAEAALAAAIRAEPWPRPPTAGPLVSVVVLNRNGGRMLDGCLDGLVRTAYRDIELIVVDNGSTDGSPDRAARRRDQFPVRVIRNDDNRSFSEANGQGVEAATGELILFLNNDIEPIVDDWLGFMVETLTARGAAAVGARLVYPRDRGTPRAGARFADLTLQHRGIDFDRATGVPLPRALGGGEDPLAEPATAVVDVPGLTAACLLVRRRDLDAVGGFDPGFDYGLEDVDLGLRLRDAGVALVYDGRAALWHHESSTRRTEAADVRQARRATNREAFLDRWGPDLYRRALLDTLQGRGGSWSEAPFRVGITVTSDDPTRRYGDWYTAHELGDALAALGWSIDYLERRDDRWYAPDAGLEAVIVLIDEFDLRRVPRDLISIAWIRNWPERWLGRPWFDDYDLVFGSSEPIVEMVRAGSAKVAELLPIATNPARFRPVEPDPELACDVLFVGNYWGEPRSVVDALPVLAAEGLDVHVHGRGWERLPEFDGLARGPLDYDDVPRAYASARFVVDDAAAPTAPYGSVNSRVFDALASGALVLSDGERGVRDLFGERFPTWSDGRDLGARIRDLGGDPAATRRLAGELRETVLERHTYPLRAATIRDAVVRWAAAERFGIRIGVPRWDVAESWGDYHFARAVQRSLERVGHPTRVHFFPDWSSAAAARDPVALHVFGLEEAPTRRAQLNLLWQISHPDLASPELYDRYDAAFVASDWFARRMAGRTRTPVRALHQATDPERFRPDPTGPRHELLFVANSRSVARKVVVDLAGTTHDLAVYGTGWREDLIEPRFVRGEGIPNVEVGRYYSSAAIVLNDHWPDMRAQGFISNRIYDALACAAFVISDDVEGIAAEFDDGVLTYRERPELEALIERYLGDPEERARIAARGRAAVLARHTFDQRAAEILAFVATLARDDRSPRPRSGAPAA